MLVAFCAVLATVVLVLTISVVRLRRRVETLTAVEQERSLQVQTAQEALRDSQVEASAASRERDEALERSRRAEREAAEGVTRLETLTGEHEAAVNEREELAAERDRLAVRVAELSQSPTSADEVSMDAELVWALTLARLDRLWRISVSSGTDNSSPLVTSRQLLADALAVVVHAAREEAGAIVDLDFEGPGAVEGATAVAVVGMFEELVAAAVEMADEARFAVTVDDDAVHLAASAVAGDRPVELPGPASLRGADGRYRIARSPATD